MSPRLLPRFLRSLDHGRVKKERIIFDESGEVYIALRRRRYIGILAALGVGSSVVCDAILTPLIESSLFRAILTFVLSTIVVVLTVYVIEN